MESRRFVLNDDKTRNFNKQAGEIVDKLKAMAGKNLYFLVFLNYREYTAFYIFNTMSCESLHLLTVQESSL